MTNKPLTVAVLIVSNRPSFIPWWTHQIAKQTRQPDSVVVVTNAADPTDFLDGSLADKTGVADTLVYSVAPTKDLLLGGLRQKALDLCHSDILLWFDDDDWYHPCRVELSAGAIETGRYDAAVIPLTHFYYLKEGVARDHYSTGGCGIHLPATAWRRSKVAEARFPNTTWGEDEKWLDRIAHATNYGYEVDSLIKYHRIYWDARYATPNVGVIVTVHGNNVWQAQDPSKMSFPGTVWPIIQLPTKAPLDVTQEEWDWTLAYFREMRLKLNPQANG